jgi:hypothetical protein
MKPLTHLLACTTTCLLLAAAPTQAATITFEDLAAGATLSNQYAGLGVVFSPNAFTGANSNSTPDDWATNTGMTVTEDDVGSVLGGPALGSGKLLHSFGDFLLENGDPSIRAVFLQPVTSISFDFVGIGAAFTSDTSLTIYNGLVVIGTVGAAACAATCQQTLSFSAPSITQVVFTPGSAADWVGVDNISFTPAVPEASSAAMLALGLGVLAWRRRSARAWTSSAQTGAQTRSH